MEKVASKTQPVLHVYVYVCMYVCIYIYIDKAIRVIYIHMYTHKITYIYIEREREGGFCISLLRRALFRAFLPRPRQVMLLAAAFGGWKAPLGAPFRSLIGV